MDLGEKLKQARLAAGLSQRQLCGEKISRTMLSQIENGSAQPSMDTLRYLAAQLEKPVSFFLGEEVTASPNQPIIRQARQAWQAGNWQQVLQLLKEYHEGDDTFQQERELLQRLAILAQGEEAICREKTIYAAELLAEMGKIEGGYCSQDLERRRLLLIARAEPGKAGAVCGQLPALDEELLLRAKAALDSGKPERCEQLLLAAEDQGDPRWNYLRGEALFARGEYQAAAAHYHRTEDTFPARTAARLERCYRELEDYKQAYFYACKQR